MVTFRVWPRLGDGTAGVAVDVPDGGQKRGVAWEILPRAALGRLARTVPGAVTDSRTVCDTPVSRLVVPGVVLIFEVAGEGRTLEVVFALSAAVRWTARIVIGE
jgi:hypothetical protein